MKENLTARQGKRLNQILKEYNLKEMSLRSVDLWFISSDIYRNISHLNKDQMFNLFDAIRYDELLIETGRSILDAALIVDSLTKTFSLKISKA